MKMLKRWLNTVSVIACILSCFILYGCGASSPGPQEPLLPTIEGLSKFSDRFQLEEEPLFFYDLFGKELLEGNKTMCSLYGCGASSLGPQEPLLPTIEGLSKFSDRFQLEEEPLFFYDLFGKELLEGNKTTVCSFD